jgi:4-amino-4-deoxy-L-arabinose transferase-like glycosyltransferase
VTADRPYTLWISFLASLLLAAYVSLWNSNTPSIRPGDEALHVSVTQGMLHHGLKLVPENDGRPYFNKPPLKMWLTQIPLRLFGESNWSYRLLDGLAGVGTAALTFYIGWLLFRSPLICFLAVVGLMGSRAYLFEHTVRHAVQDSVLVFLSTAAIVAGWKLRYAERVRNQLLWGVVGGAFIGCAILVKHVGGLIPLVVVGTAFLWLDQGKVFRNRALLIFGLVGLLVAASYYLPVFLLYPEAWKTLVGVEVVERARDGFHNSGKSWFYLHQIFLKGVTLPPVLLISALFFGLIGVCIERTRERVFLLVWAIVPVVLYSIPPSRLIWYIAPAFPAMALLVARFIERLITIGFRAGNPAFVRWGSAAFIVAGVLQLGWNYGFVANRVRIPADRIEFDWLTEQIATAPRNSAAAKSVVFFRGYPPGPFERVYLRRLARGASVRMRSPQQLASSIQARTVRFVVAPIREFEQIVRMGSVIGYRFIRPSKPVPRWMLRQEWYVILVYDNTDLTRAFSAMERAVPLTAHDGAWGGVVVGDHATDTLGGTLWLSNCQDEGTKADISGFELAAEAWGNSMVVRVPSGMLRVGENELKITSTCQLTQPEFTTFTVGSVP